MTKTLASKRDSSEPVPSGNSRSNKSPSSDAPSSDAPSSDAPSSFGVAASPAGAWRTVRGVVRTMRPHQWVKNLFVLAPVVFAKHLTDAAIIVAALAAFAVFCMLASAIYTLNDLLDADVDRVHPVKRHRPIAARVVSHRAAKAMVIALLIVSLGAAALGPSSFFLIACSYFVLNTAYSLRLKRVAYLDVACIAMGFVLRVLAGGAATSTPVSGYMLACTALLALFLGFGKRQHEIGGATAKKQRAALEGYSPRVLLGAMMLTGLLSVVAYVGYALDPHTRTFFRSEWLWLTSLHPVLGVLRFVQLVRTRPRAESPTQEMLRDTLFVLNLSVWIGELIFILYRLRPT
ncbi:MAG: decaprenyl-phosphate phosphoribosyltransferase [Myxococcales bacterium]|nr:decaprenyl-phosphate phosphoribosyltransferase [Myxococcales bacterium]